jgi:hypothetical protein
VLRHALSTLLAIRSGLRPSWYSYSFASSRQSSSKLLKAIIVEQLAHAYPFAAAPALTQTRRLFVSAATEILLPGRPFVILPADAGEKSQARLPDGRIGLLDQFHTQ